LEGDMSLAAQLVASLGTATAAVGAGLLFFYGPPGVPTDPAAIQWIGTSTPDQVRRHHFKKALSWVGLALGVFGATAQIVANWL